MRNKLIFVLVVDRHKLSTNRFTELLSLLPGPLLWKQLDKLGTKSIPAVRKSCEYINETIPMYLTICLKKITQAFYSLSLSNIEANIHHNCKKVVGTHIPLSPLFAAEVRTFIAREKVRCARRVQVQVRIQPISKTPLSPCWMDLRCLRVIKICQNTNQI